MIGNSPVLQRQRLPQRWLTTIVDRNGLVVARSRESDLYVGKKARATTLSRLAIREDLIYQSRSLDGIDSLVFSSTIPASDWKILANRAIAPIEALGDSAQALGDGVEVHYRPLGWAELDNVAQRLAEASTRIRHAQGDMEARVATAIAASERAQTALLKNQKLEALGRLTDGIAHEYNNLLQTLTTALQLAAFSTREDKVKALIQTCQRTVTRATALTGQLGSFGRQQEARMATVDICDQLHSAVQLMKGSLRNDVAVEVHCEKDVWPVALEPLQFDTALLNLALNGRNAMPGGGTLRLQASNVVHDGMGDIGTTLARGDYVLVSMTDTGCGMPPDVMARALAPFFTTKPAGQGTGLGLPPGRLHEGEGIAMSECRK